MALAGLRPAVPVWLAVLTLAATLGMWPWWLELGAAWTRSTLWHGPMASALSLYLVMRLGKRRAGEANPSLIPWAASGLLTAPVLLLGFNRAYLAMLVYLLGMWCLCGVAWGWPAQKRLWPAFAILPLALPWLGHGGLSLLASLAKPLSVHVAAAAAGVLAVIGVHPLLEGPRLLMEGNVLEVGLHCAGVQYLEVFSLLVFTAVALRGWPRLPWLFFSTLILGALAANVLRVAIVAALVAKAGLQDIALVDQAAGVLLMFTLLPLIWVWPLREPAAAD